MIATFISHISKNFFRSSSLGKLMTAKIALGLIAFVVVVYSVAAGFALEMILVNDLKQTNPVGFLNGLLIYYFISEFIMRYFIQSLPALDAQPYLHLPIARSKITNFLLGRSMVHVMNVFIFLLFTPFALSAVANAYGIAQAWMWLLSLWFISLTNHFIVLLFKKSLDHNVWGLLVIIVVSGALAASNYFGWFTLSTVSEMVFGTTLQGYWITLVFFLQVVLLYAIAYRFFIKRLYPEELSVDENQSFHSSNWTFLQKFGLTGSFIKLELKLIFRNKRSREVFFLSIVFFFQALIFYLIIKDHTAYGTFLFLGVICSGLFMINYGQFLFSWQGAHFDFTLTQPASIRLYVESKYWLLISFTVLWFLFSIPFVYIGWHILLVNFVATLFNVGINIFVVMNMAMWGAKRIDLKHSGTLNYEGMGAAQWVMGIPIFASPYIFYLPFSLMGHPILGLVSVGIAGLIGIVFHRKLIDITSQRLFDMRYNMSSDFRKD